MCQDLGGESFERKGTNLWSIGENQHGDFYLRGINEPILPRSINQEISENREKWLFDWSPEAKAKIELEQKEEDFNPCPSGWRLPTCKEFEDLMDYNTRMGYLHSQYSSCVIIGNSLVLPASGFRRADDYDDNLKAGDLSHFGFITSHWITKSPCSKVERKKENKNSDSFAFYHPNYTESDIEYILDKPTYMRAMPVRCIKEN